MVRVVARLLAAVSLFTGVIAIGASSAQAAGAVVTVTDGNAPGWIRFDSAGNGIDAHDGEIKQFGSKYYLYGTSYGCGYLRMHGHSGDSRPVTPFCGFVVYESTDLRHWNYDGKLFDPSTTTPTNWQATCNSASLSCYRPHVLYDAAAHQYRLWVNTYDGNRGYHVLSSSSPTGPFVEAADSAGHAIRPQLAMPNGGDFDLFQDSNGVGYIVYTVRYTGADPNYSYELVIEQLSKNYTTGTGIFTPLGTRHTEAPSMFKRGSTYYITMADPFCAYCAGTGTAYLWAKSPLGPWQGVGSNVVPVAGQMFDDSRSGLFTGTAPATQFRLRWAYNYDFAFRARPLPTLLDGHTTRVGWMFRASDTGNGYLWVLSNLRKGTAPARLIHNIVKNGNVVKSWATPVPVPLSSTTMNVIRTRAIRGTIQTWLNGKLVDTTKDKTFKNGYAGVRQMAGYSAYYDDFSVSRPPSLGYQLWLADNLNSGSLANFPTLYTYRRHGVKISADSCGGQPADVAMLRAPSSTGNEYLFQSDRWDHGNVNEATAQQYWTPLQFNADGSIAPLMCGPVFTTTLSDATQSDYVGVPNPSIDGFDVAEDITSTLQRGQRFQVTTAGNLTQVALTLLQTDTGPNGDVVNADLTVSLYDVGGPNGTPSGTPIATATVPATQVGFSPRTMTVPLTAPLSPHSDGTPGNYAIVLSTTSTTGAYGTARSDGSYDADPTGAGLVGTVDQSSTVNWAAEMNDLRYTLTVQQSTT